MTSHIAAAQNETTLAAQAVTGKETRQHWAAADGEVKQALQLDAQNQEAKQILAQVRAELDKIDNVVTLTPAVLWDFKTPGQRHLTSQGFSLFALDRLANQVNRLILNTAGDKLESNPEPILVPGVTVNGQAPGNLIDFTSMASSVNRQAGDLVIGHDKGLIEYSLSFGLQTLPFGDNTLTSSVKRLRSFDGKLYALDPDAQQIMKYEPQGNGYPAAPTPYFGQALPDLAKATDMAIDGNVYVALADGRLSPNLVRRGYNGGSFDGDPTAFNTSDPWNDVITPTVPDAGKQDYDNVVVGAQVDWDFGAATLTYIPSYFYLDWAADYWLEDRASFLSAHYNQTTHECAWREWRATGGRGWRVPMRTA